MPGMSTGMETSGASAALVLAELTLFWTVTVLHVLRLLSPARLCDADRLEDAGHVAMGAGMTAMVFPGAPSTALRVMAVVFAVLAVAFFARAVHRRDSTGHRDQNAAIGAGQLAMAYMLALPAHSPTWLPAAVAGVLALCVLVHGQRLIDAGRRTRHGAASPGTNRILVTLPHAGTLVTTVAMAWAVATT